MFLNLRVAVYKINVNKECLGQGGSQSCHRGLTYGSQPVDDLHRVQRHLHIDKDRKIPEEKNGKKNVKMHSLCYVGACSAASADYRGRGELQ